MSDRQEFIDRILEHYENPRHRRRMETPAAVAEGRTPGCGDRLTIYLQIEHERIREASFEGQGCAISLAAASMLTDQLVGKTLAEVSTLGPALMAELLGAAALANRPRCALLALRTAQQAVVRYRSETHAV